MSGLVNVRKKELNKRKIKDFVEWQSMANTLYIGRNMDFYVKGTKKSKWCNPFSVKKYGRDKCLELYKDYIINSTLYSQLDELVGKELGCWCCPEPCHGNILMDLVEEKYNELVNLCVELDENLNVDLLDGIKLLEKFDDGYCIFSTMGNIWTKVDRNVRKRIEGMFGLSFSSPQ